MSRYAPHRKLWLLVKLIFPAMLHLRTGGNIFDYPVGVRMRRLSLCFQRSFTGTARQRSGMSTPERCWDIASVFRATNCKEATRRLLSSLVSGKGNRRCAEASARCRVYYSGFTHGGNARWGEMQQYFVCRDQPTGNCGHHHTFFCFARK